MLLHGADEFWTVWLNVVGDLVHTHRVIVIDLPGHGDSLDVDGKLDGDTLLRWLGALLDVTCEVPPVLVGHLLGGAIAARYAIANSDRFGDLWDDLRDYALKRARTPQNQAARPANVTAGPCASSMGHATTQPPSSPRRSSRHRAAPWRATTTDTRDRTDHDPAGTHPDPDT